MTQDPTTNTHVETAAHFLQGLHGKWVGQCKTWFEPEKLADESEFSGEFAPVFDGKFVRFRYQSTIQGKPRTGEALLAYNAIAKQFQESWIDSFHMNYAIQFSEGQIQADGFFVFGEYDAAPEHPKWGWRTEYQRIDNDQLVITAYNISPEGQQAKALETKLSRMD